MSRHGKTEIKKGKEYLPKISMSRLENYYKKEGVPIAKTRILACIKRKEGIPIRRIARELDSSYTAVYDWLARIQKGGLGRRYNRKPPGRNSRLTPEQEKQLKLDLRSAPEKSGFKDKNWSTQLVKTYINKNFDRDYSNYGILILLERLGLSWRKIYKKPRKRQIDKNKKHK